MFVLSDCHFIPRRHLWCIISYVFKSKNRIQQIWKQYFNIEHIFGILLVWIFVYAFRLPLCTQASSLVPALFWISLSGVSTRLEPYHSPLCWPYCVCGLVYQCPLCSLDITLASENRQVLHSENLTLNIEYLY